MTSSDPPQSGHVLGLLSSSVFIPLNFAFLRALQVEHQAVGPVSIGLLMLSRVLMANAGTSA